MAILRHVEATPDEREAYLKCAARCGAVASEEARSSEARQEAEEAAARSSSASALRRDVGGRGVPAHRHRKRLRQAHVVLRVPHHRPRRQRHRRDGPSPQTENVGTQHGARRVLPGRGSDQIMLVTDGGQLIRCPVDGIRIAGRSTKA